MAQLKLNVYHFHFTENPGWRLESKIYPELNDSRNYTRMPGKFYTQKEFKQLVEYCRLQQHPADSGDGYAGAQPDVPQGRST